MKGATAKRNVHQAGLVALASEANRLHETACSHAKSAVEAAVSCGRVLLQIKANVGHGHFATWLADNFDGSARTARAYMQVSKGLPANWQHVANLESFRDALALIQQPRREEIVSEDGDIDIHALNREREAHERRSSEIAERLGLIELQLIAYCAAPTETPGLVGAVAELQRELGELVSELGETRLRMERRLGEIINRVPWAGYALTHPVEFDRMITERIEELAAAC